MLDIIKAKQPKNATHPIRYTQNRQDIMWRISYLVANGLWRWRQSRFVEFSFLGSESSLRWLSLLSHLVIFLMSSNLLYDVNSLLWRFLVWEQSRYCCIPSGRICAALFRRLAMFRDGLSRQFFFGLFGLRCSPRGLAILVVYFFTPRAYHWHHEKWACLTKIPFKTSLLEAWFWIRNSTWKKFSKM